MITNFQRDEKHNFTERVLQICLLSKRSMRIVGGILHTNKCIITFSNIGFATSRLKQNIFISILNSVIVL